MSQGLTLNVGMRESERKPKAKSKFDMSIRKATLRTIPRREHDTNNTKNDHKYII